MHGTPRYPNQFLLPTSIAMVERVLLFYRADTLRDLRGSDNAVRDRQDSPQRTDGPLDGND